MFGGSRAAIVGHDILALATAFRLHSHRRIWRDRHWPLPAHEDFLGGNAVLGSPIRTASRCSICIISQRSPPSRYRVNKNGVP